MYVPSTCLQEIAVVLLYVRESFNANKSGNFSAMYEYVKTWILSFSVGEVYYVIGKVYRPPNSNNDDFMPEFQMSWILP